MMVKTTINNNHFFNDVNTFSFNYPMAVKIIAMQVCNILHYYISRMFYERGLAKKIPTCSMLDSVLLFLTNNPHVTNVGTHRESNIPHVTDVGLTENPTKRT